MQSRVELRIVLVHSPLTGTELFTQRFIDRLTMSGSPHFFENYAFKKQLIVFCRGNFLASRLGPTFLVLLEALYFLEFSVTGTVAHVSEFVRFTGKSHRIFFVVPGT